MNFLSASLSASLSVRIKSDKIRNRTYGLLFVRYYKRKKEETDLVISQPVTILKTNPTQMLDYNYSKPISCIF